MTTKNKLLILFGAIIIMVASIIFFLNDNNKNTSKDSSKKTEEVTTNTNKETKEDEELVDENTSEDSSTYSSGNLHLYRENIGAYGNGDEYDYQDGKILKKEFIDYAIAMDYESIIEKADNLSTDNKFSEGDNLDIAGIIQDANLLQPVSNHETEYADYGATVNLMSTPEMLLIATLKNDVQAQKYTLQDSSSLSIQGVDSLVFKEVREYSNKAETEDEPLFQLQNMAYNIFNMYGANPEGVNAVYAYDLYIDDILVDATAYIWEDLYGKLHFYGIYIADDVKHYEQTLQWYVDNVLPDIEAIRADLESGEYYEDKELEDYTQEEIEAALDSMP